MPIDYEGWVREIYRVRPLVEHEMGIILPVDFKVKPFLTGDTRRETRRIRRDYARSQRAVWALEASWCLGGQSSNDCPQSGSVMCTDGERVQLQAADVGLLHWVQKGIDRCGYSKAEERRLLRLQRLGFVRLTEHMTHIYWTLSERMARLMDEGYLTSV